MVARKFLCNTLGWSLRLSTKDAQKLPQNVEEVLTNIFLRKASIVRDHASPAVLGQHRSGSTCLLAKSSRNMDEIRCKASLDCGSGGEVSFGPSISASGVLLPMQAILMGKMKASCPSPNTPSYAEPCAKALSFCPPKQVHTGQHWRRCNP